MSGPQTYETLSREALEQHQQIHFFLERIEASLHAIEEGGGDPEQIARFAAEVESFRDRIAEHHRHEVEGGLFQAIVETLPDAAPEVHRLKEQHERIGTILEMARLHARNARPADIAALRDELLEFVETMREHERAEETLFRRALAHEPQES